MSNSTLPRTGYSQFTCTQKNSGDGPTGPVVLTFGSLSADYENYLDLPTNESEGSWASHISTGETYRLLKTEAIPVWVPAEVYGGTPSLLGYITGEETEDTDLLAQGFFQVSTEGTDPNVGIVYEGSSVLFKCSGSTVSDNVVGANSISAFVDMTGQDENLRLWVFARMVIIDPINSVSGPWARWFRYRDGNGKGIQCGSVRSSPTQHWNWTDTQLSGFGNQLVSSSNLSPPPKPTTTPLNCEYFWDNATSRYFLKLNHEFEGGIGELALPSSVGEQSLVIRVEAANNQRQNMRVYRYFAVGY